MKTSSEELHEYLTGLDDEGLFGFCCKIDHRMPVIIPDYSQLARGGPSSYTRQAPIAEWVEGKKNKISEQRGPIIDAILATKHSDPGLFEKTLRAANIRADEGRALALADQSNKIAREARLIAYLSALAAAASAVYAVWTYYR